MRLELLYASRRFSFWIPEQKFTFDYFAEFSKPNYIGNIFTRSSQDLSPKKSKIDQLTLEGNGFFSIKVAEIFLNIVGLGLVF